MLVNNYVEILYKCRYTQYDEESSVKIAVTLLTNYQDMHLECE